MACFWQFGICIILVAGADGARVRRVRIGHLDTAAEHHANVTADSFKCCKVTQSRLWPPAYKYGWNGQTTISYSLSEFHCKQGRPGLDFLSMTKCKTKWYDSNRDKGKYPSFADTVLYIDEVETVDGSECADVDYCNNGDSYKSLIHQEVQTYREKLFDQDETYPAEWKDLWKLLKDLIEEKRSRSRLAQLESGAWEDEAFDSMEKRMHFQSKVLSDKIGEHDRKGLAEKIVVLEPSSTLEELMSGLDAKQLTEKLSQLEQQKQEADMRKEILESSLVPDSVKDVLKASATGLHEIWAKFEVVKAISGLEAGDGRGAVDVSDPLVGSWDYPTEPGNYGRFQIRRSEESNGLEFVEGDIKSDIAPPTGVAGAWVYGDSIYQLIAQVDDADRIQFVQGKSSGMLTRSGDAELYEGDVSKPNVGVVGRISVELSDGKVSSTFETGGDTPQTITNVASRYPWRVVIPDVGSLYFKQLDEQLLILKFIQDTESGASQEEAFRSGRLISDPPQNEELDSLWSASLEASDSISTLRKFCQSIAGELEQPLPEKCKTPVVPKPKVNGGRKNKRGGNRRGGGFGMNMRTGMRMGMF